MGKFKLLELVICIFIVAMISMVVIKEIMQISTKINTIKENIENYYNNDLFES